MTDPDARGEARGTLGTVRNAVLLLNLLSDGPTYQQLSDLAERSGLSLATVHRLLRSLVLAGLAEQEPGSARYGLGPELVRLSHRYLTRLPILAALAPYLVPLRDAVGATVQVAVLVRGAVVYVDRVDAGDGGPYRHPHRVHDALATAAGRVLAARADEERWEQVLAAATPAQREAARNRRSAWRDAPYLVDDGEAPGLHHEIAVPVVDGAGRTAGALAAALALDAPDRQVSSLAAHLSRAASAAGRALSNA